MFQLGGIVVTLVNGLLGLLLWRWLRAALPRRSTFVEAREMPFDLMLSGHTHGGHISLGRVGDHAITPLLPAEFYHNGLYEHRGRRLYVNAGAGGWLPVRINCPPEITLVELVPA